MGSIYSFGAVSIADARENARLWLVPAQPCAQGTALTLSHEQQLIAPLFAGQGTSVSAADHMIATKRVRTFAKTHLGPQLSSGTG